MPTETNARRQSRLPLLLLALFIAAEIGINAFWLRANVTPYGRDAWSYLYTMRAYLDMAATPAWDTLFRMFTYHDFRPPLLWLSALPLALPFPQTPDGVTFVNTLFLAVTLLATYGLGVQLSGRWTGLLGAFLVGTFPMLFGLSRLFYAEVLLTALIALNLYFLVRSDGFAHRRFALLWGCTLGLGMLAKWTMPAFVGLPALLIAVRSGLLNDLRQALRARTPDWRSFGLALLGGLAVAALWVLPAWSTITQERLLGAAILPLTWLFATLMLYVLMEPASRATNLLGGVFVAAFMSSLWYFARIEFVSPFTETAVVSDRTETIALSYLLEPGTYVYYLRFLVRDIIGPVYAMLLLPALWPWLRRRTQAIHNRDAAIVLWACAIGGYVIFTLSILRTDRMMIPLLPALGVVAAYGLLQLRPSRLRHVWIALVVLFGLLQFGVFSFDQGEPLVDWVDSRGARRVFATTAFTLRPASGITHPGYAIAPYVLEEVDRRTPGGGPEPKLGILVNSPQIHTSVFRYEADAMGVSVDIDNLGDDSGWRDVVNSEWLLTKDGDNHDVDLPGLRALEEVYDNPDGAFPILFEPAANYPLPNGETATLWRRSVQPAYVPDLESLADRLSISLGGNTMLLSRPDQALWLGLHGIAPDRVLLMGQGRPDDTTLFVLLHQGEPSDDAAMRWIEETYYPAHSNWYDSEFLHIWGRPTSDLRTKPAAHTFGDAALETIATVANTQAGTVIPLDLKWSQFPQQPRNVSVRLIDDGTTIAQVDRDIHPGMRLGIYVPPDTPTGDYSITLRVYDPSTLDPVPDAGGKTLTVLATVTIAQ